MSYKVAGIDVHERHWLFVADVEVDGEYEFERPNRQLSERKSGLLIPKRHQMKHLEF